MRQLAHVVRPKRVAENVEVFRFQIPGVLWDFVKIGIDAPLTDFVTNHWHTGLGDVLAVIRARLRRESINTGLKALAPSLDAWVGRDVKLICRNLGPSRAAGVKAPRVPCSPMLDPFRQIFRRVV